MPAAVADRVFGDGREARGIEFLDEIGKTPLLTKGQEVYLAKRIERGDSRAMPQTPWPLVQPPPIRA